MSDHQDTQIQSIDLPKLADAQDGSEVLFAVARLLEQKHGPDYGYAALMRRNAHAIRDITEQMQPWIVANEPDPLLEELWQAVSPRDDVMGAGKHCSDLTYRLGINQ